MKGRGEERQHYNISMQRERSFAESKDEWDKEK